MIPLSEANGIGQIVWSPLAQGVLSGKYKPGEQPPADSRAASEEMGGFIAWLMKDDTLSAVQKLKPLADEAGCTLAQFAIAWVLRLPNVTAAIVGASRPEQVSENAAASDLAIDPGLFAKAETIISTVKADYR